MKTYYLFFNVRDSEKCISNVMDSIINQSYKPKKITVIDDGSTDKTGQILDSYQEKFPDLINVIHTNSKTRDYSRIPTLWNMCLEKEYDYHMIGAGDTIYELDYAEKLIKKMECNPNLVICSGDFGKQKSLSPHATGRFVKQSFFFSNYNKYHEIIGYESEILHRAMIQNFEIKIFNDIRFDHVEKLGEKHNFSEWGESMKSIGFHPLYAFARCFLIFFRATNVSKKGAWKIFWKYITYQPNKSGYYSQFPKEFRDEIRKEQLGKIKNFVLKRLKRLIHT